MATFIRRLEKLEKAVQRLQMARWKYECTRGRLTPQDEKIKEAMYDLIGRMSPQYARLFERDANRPREVQKRGAGDAACNLALAVFACAEGHVKEGRPLEMPDAVAAVYVADLEADTGGQECEECGFQAPISPTLKFSDPAYPFRACPLCGGRISWCGFGVKRNAAQSFLPRVKTKVPGLVVE
jgi:hypothetical protein